MVILSGIYLYSLSSLSLGDEQESWFYFAITGLSCLLVMAYVWLNGQIRLFMNGRQVQSGEKKPAPFRPISKERGYPEHDQAFHFSLSAEEQLNYLNKLIDNINEFVCIFDRAGHIRYANRKAWQTWRYSRQEM
jgi:PAS domain-containing protein